MRHLGRSRAIGFALVIFVSSLLAAYSVSLSRRSDFNLPPKTYYRRAKVLGHDIFYREAGDPSKATIVLLHGYPSSSHTYRELIPILAASFHVVAPDYIGSGYSAHPSPSSYTYTFDKLADHVEGLMNQLKLDHYFLYMQDFGAPVGFRLMMRHPESIIGFISQNANAYLDGLTEKRREFFLDANRDRSPAHVATLFEWTGEDAIVHRQYLRDVPKDRWDEVSPDAWTFDLNFLRTDEGRRIQVQLFQDYQTNIDQYPQWQALMREKQFPALIVWGKNDAAFIADGARAYLRDLPNARLHLLDAGHFAVEEKCAEVAKYVLEFMDDTLKKGPQHSK